jgi:hypothetical protein
VPKVSLNFPESGVFDLKKRYNNMYVPSDFFMADHSWMKSFPVHDGFKIQYASTFHVFNKVQIHILRKLLLGGRKVKIVSKNVHKFSKIQ